MDAAELIIARSNLITNIQKIQNSLDEIKKNNPKRIDLIRSAEESIEQLTYTYVFFCELEQEFRVSRQRNRDLEFSTMVGTRELDEIRNVNEKLMEETELYLRDIKNG